MSKEWVSEGLISVVRPGTGQRRLVRIEEGDLEPFIEKARETVEEEVGRILH